MRTLCNMVSLLFWEYLELKRLKTLASDGRFSCSLSEKKTLLKPKVLDGSHADLHRSCPGCHNNAFLSAIYLSWLEELGKLLVSGQLSWKRSHRGVRAQIKWNDRKWCQRSLDLDSEENATTFLKPSEILSGQNLPEVQSLTFINFTIVSAFLTENQVCF